MSEFQLKPARIRDGKFVSDRTAEPIQLKWSDLVDRFSPRKTRTGMLLLRRLHPGVFVGTRKVKGLPVTFTFDTAGRSRDAKYVMKQDPTFVGSLIEVFFVEQVKWDTFLKEFKAG